MDAATTVAIPEACRPFMAQAVVRLSYLHPKVQFTCTEDTILAEYGASSVIPPSEITYQVYREKIYQESLPMRELMYKALLS